MDNIKKICITVMMICVLLLQGCRPSPAIRTPNIDNSGKKTNTEAQIENPNAKEKNTDIKSNRSGESDNKSTEKKKEAGSNTDAKGNKGVKAVYTYSKDGQNTSSAAAGFDTQTNGKAAASGGDEGGVSTDGIGDSAGAGKSTGQGDGDGGSGGSGDKVTPPSVDAPGETRQIYDANGEVKTVPKNIDRVTAVGEASSVLEMLGGTGRLVATSEDFKINNLAANIFSDLKNVPALWTGSGTDGISDANFQTLLSQKPQVCFYISGANTFTDAQLNALKSANITPVVLPKPSTTSHLKDLVTIVGSTLGDRSGTGGTNATDIANQYKSYLTNSMNEMSSKVKRATDGHTNYDIDRNATSPWNNTLPFNMWSSCTDTTDSIKDGTRNLGGYGFTGRATALITDWDNNAVYRWHAFDSGYSNYIEGSGAPVVRYGADSSPLTYYMSIAGIVNNGAQYFDNENNNYTTRYAYYLPCGEGGGGQSTISGKYQSGKYVINHGLTTLCLMLGNYTFKDNGNENTYTNKFTGLVATNNKIKNAIEQEESKQISPWKSYKFSYLNSISPGDGFMYEGHQYYTEVCGSFDIFVNPKGVAPWTDGTPESVLESLWLASKFYPSNVSETEVKNKVREFYKTFYRHNLTDGELALILAGPES